MILTTSSTSFGICFFQSVEFSEKDIILDVYSITSLPLGRKIGIVGINYDYLREETKRCMIMILFILLNLIYNFKIFVIKIRYG